MNTLVVIIINIMVLTFLNFSLFFNPVLELSWSNDARSLAPNIIHTIATPSVITAYITKMIMKVTVVRINWAQNTMSMIIAIERPTPIINGVHSFLDHARDIADTRDVNSNLVQRSIKRNFVEISE